MTDLAYMPLVEVANLLEKRELSPVELTQSPARPHRHRRQGSA